ncbi:hypothetical protein [Jannaschia ovalis]|uniref:Uncharacterized protein n=1 Tax=Jannaschia ovalis TaxID=3038773 RepID=A0ABY8LDU6_9RHOB|nr:hypothetical protein [Jannaschia sp. GRR-S6-38]WGH79477.1 hypothetical protein P8627_04200 [Jannaschia sp. GRR-S6-38]
MTRTNLCWAIGIWIASIWFGVSVMFGHIPGLDSDVGTFHRIARLTAMAAAEHGFLLTGLGATLSGLVIGLLCLAFGDGSPDGGMGLD